MASLGLHLIDNTSRQTSNNYKEYTHPGKIAINPVLQTFVGERAAALDNLAMCSKMGYALILKNHAFFTMMHN